MLVHEQLYCDEVALATIAGPNEIAVPKAQYRAFTLVKQSRLFESKVLGKGTDGLV